MANRQSEEAKLREMMLSGVEIGLAPAESSAAVYRAGDLASNLDLNAGPGVIAREILENLNRRTLRTGWDDLLSEFGRVRSGAAVSHAQDMLVDNGLVDLSKSWTNRHRTLVKISKKGRVVLQAG